MFRPAIELAENGFPVSYALAGQLDRGEQKLAQFASTTDIWFKDGRPLRAGELVDQTPADIRVFLR